MAHPEVHQPTLGELFSNLTRNLSLLFRQEVELAKKEMSFKVTRARNDVLRLAVGGVVGFIGALALVAALILILDTFMAAWLAALIVGAIVTGVGVVLLKKGLDDLKQVDLKPQLTVETLKDDVQWAKELRR